MARGIRRVVTGHDENGKAVILFDGDAPNARVRPGRAAVSTLLWVTDDAPAQLSGSDNAEREIGITPPINGSIFRILELPPEQEKSALETERLIEDMLREQSENPQPGLYRAPTTRAMGMHRTESVDYALVLEGEIDLLLDDTETRLKAGDMVVMQGTYHAWSNRSGKTCMMAFILIGADVPWKSEN
ncbi:MAG: cupin domain-containing protein [Rhodospirillales bacterium]